MLTLCLTYCPMDVPSCSGNFSLGITYHKYAAARISEKKLDSGVFYTSNVLTMIIMLKNLQKATERRPKSTNSKRNFATMILERLHRQGLAWAATASHCHRGNKKTLKVKIFAHNSTLCVAIVPPCRPKLWYACSRRKKAFKSMARRNPTRSKRQMRYAALAKIIELYLKNESGIFAFLVYIAIMNLPTIKNLQQGGV